MGLDKEDVTEEGGGSGWPLGRSGSSLLSIVTGFSLWPPLLVFLGWYSTSLDKTLVVLFWEVGRVFMMRVGKERKISK